MLILILSLFCTYTHALTKFDTNCTLPAETVNYVSAPNTRGTLTILWANLLTIILCTWTVQHPDIPRPRENFVPGFNGKIEHWSHKYTRQLVWFVITIIAPEVLLAKHGYDLWEAKSDLHELQTRAQEDEVEWTITHSLFANMGGFVMRVNSASSGRRPLGMCLTRPSEPEPVLHELSTNEDGLPHPLPIFPRRAIMRASRLSLDSNYSITAVPPPARHSTRHSTARLGHCHFLSGRDILQLRRENVLFQLSDITEKELQDRSKADWLLRLITVWQILWMVIQIAVRGATRLAVAPLEIGVVAFASCAVVTYVLSWNKPKGVQVPITILEVRGGGEQVFEALGHGESASMTDLSQQSRTFRQQIVSLVSPVLETLVATPVFGIACIPDFLAMPVLLGVLLGGSLFGGIHLIAWRFPFPSDTEQFFWRFAAVYCTCAPLAITLPRVLYYLYDRFECDSQAWELFWKQVFLVWLYPVARVYLLVAMFRTLAYQPPDAYVGTWADIIIPFPG
ncbi:hypothetical protein ASPACDRAFT_35503 [Aspergillus aculeatus ATCC 16872]|uniref:Uncharacterized protein n=1 Tax=Aspergillus aculeatus (strain ATCC 16872 / CBS 172.66 / WB 5094) TaxID=690307 RepID=A0A1L9WIK8_ASPA1|nr:uncharacterized protein ASPACDRAFT_35503 [Aspergillus aculeatus ATCC 16872]OJJ96022.1 hypothetical protein ASPACDRAFT_35503 [Aspergillus aculeatus ATCC 16872]